MTEELKKAANKFWLPGGVVLGLLGIVATAAFVAASELTNRDRDVEELKKWRDSEAKPSLKYLAEAMIRVEERLGTLPDDIRRKRLDEHP